MEKLFYVIPYIKTFQAVVLECRKGKDGRGAEVVLDRTGFYPEGGGQPCDTGMLEGTRVLAVHEKNGEIIHYIQDQLFESGQKVNATIDWDRRYSNMQQHTGEHIFSGLVHRHFGYDNVGFHMGSEDVTVDFNGVLTEDQVSFIEAEANRTVYANEEIRTLFPEPKELESLAYRSKKELTGQVRIVEIPGSDCCACCGTHVMRTGEVGIIKVTGLMNYKGGVRISILCGKRAAEEFERKRKQILALSNMLSSKPAFVVDAVEKVVKGNQSKDELIGRLYRELLELKAGQYPSGEESLIIFEENLPPIQLRQYCTLLYEGGRGSVVLVCSGEEGHYQYAAGSAKYDMRVFSGEMNKRLNGKGGGSSLMAQGTFETSKEAVQAAFVEMIS